MITVVIGGSHGIGLEVLKKQLELGAEVFNYSRTSPPVEHPSLLHRECDILVGDIDKETFPETIDKLVYCPGSINLKPIRGLKLLDFREEMEINFFGAVKVMKACLAALKKSDSASVVMFSTVAVGQGMPFHSSISASKGAIEGFARSLAAELAPGIRVNVVSPSLTDTPLAERLLSTDKQREGASQRHPLKRYGQSADIASAANFLLSDESSWITGQVIGVDGGLSVLRI